MHHLVRSPARRLLYDRRWRSPVNNSYLLCYKDFSKGVDESKNKEIKTIFNYIQEFSQSNEVKLFKLTCQKTYQQAKGFLWNYVVITRPFQLGLIEAKKLIERLQIPGSEGGATGQDVLAKAVLPKPVEEIKQSAETSISPPKEELVSTKEQPTENHHIKNDILKFLKVFKDVGKNEDTNAGTPNNPQDQKPTLEETKKP